MNELDEKANEAHHCEAQTDSSCNGVKFLTIRFGAFLDQMHGIFGKLAQWLDEHLIETLFVRHFWKSKKFCALKRIKSAEATGGWINIKNT